jgi:hypothetical protein
MNVLNIIVKLFSLWSLLKLSIGIQIIKVNPEYIKIK